MQLCVQQNGFSYYEQAECGDPEPKKHLIIHCKNYSRKWKKLFKNLGAAEETALTLYLTLLNWITDQK